MVSPYSSFHFIFVPPHPSLLHTSLSGHRLFQTSKSIHHLSSLSPDAPLTLYKATHSSERPQQLTVGKADEGERHDEAKDEKEPGEILAAIFGAHGIPVRATGALQALRHVPAKGQARAQLWALQRKSWSGS